MKKQWKKALLVLAVAVCMVVSAVFSVSAATTTDENAGTIKVVSDGVVSQAYSEISTYRTEGNYTAPGTPSGYSDYVFAGWFSDETCTTETTATSGSAYAKFVVKDVMGVKAQFLAGTVYDSEKSSMRFVTTVDSLDYEEVGFKCVLNGETKTAKSSTVYKKLYAAFTREDGSTAYSELLPTSFSETTSKYFMACILKNIPNADFGDAIEITPYWVTLDGTTVYGDTVVKTVNNGYIEITTDLTATVEFDYSTAYKNWIDTSTYSYAVQGGCTDGTYYYQSLVYQASSSSEGENDHAYIIKIDMATGEIVQCSGQLKLHHANDFTYNKDLDCLVMLHNLPYNKRISFIDKDDLTIINPNSLNITFGDGVQIYADETGNEYITTSHKEEVTKSIFGYVYWRGYEDVENNLFAMEYNSYHQKYVVGISGGDSFRIYNKDFSDPNAYTTAYVPNEISINYTRQGVAADDSYIYFIFFNENSGDETYPNHIITVYDWNGNYVTTSKINDTSIPVGGNSYEPENVTIYNNVMYISCQNKKIYKVAEMEINTSEYEARIGDYYYETLEDAIDAVEEGQTITIISEKVSVSENLTIEKANVTITNEAGVNVVVKKGADFSGILIGNKATDLKIQSAETGSLTFTGNGYSGNSLIYNYTDGTLTITGVTFKNLVASGAGAAVRVGAGTVAIDTCKFENNTASTQAGALWVGSGATVTVDNSEFTGNSTVNNTGGAIFSQAENLTVTETDFIQNEAATTAGAINCGSGNMTLTSCNFTENKANNGNGGAVQVADGAQATINGTGTFEGNTATGQGGALRINNAKVTVEGQTFDGNTSGENGGAVDIQSGTNSGAYTDAYVFTNNKFVNNEAGAYGGAIWSGTRELSITGCTFGDTKEVESTDDEGNAVTETVSLGNTAASDGGAIYTNAANLTIKSSEFNSNKASNQGGAVWIPSGKTVGIEDTNFEGNKTTSSNGGAIYTKGTLNLTNVDFISNEAKNSGGAFHSEGGTTTAENCDFTSNKAGGNGGACRIVAGGSATFTGTGTFSGNQTTGNSAVGGAIQVNSATLSVTGYTFDNNTSKANGGAVYIQDNTTSASFTDSTFTNNSVTNGNGGAIYAQQDVTITDTTFGGTDKGNKATAGNGGAIYLTNSKTVTLTKTDGKATPNFVGNAAKLGGAIYTDTGVIDVTNYNFVSNSATSHGGAVYLGEIVEKTNTAEDGTTSTETVKNAGTLNATSCIFEGNKGTHGAATFVQCGELNITTGTFNTNIASTQGGAIYLAADGTCKIEENSMFNGNEATGASGGAIYKKGAMTVTDTDFTGNKAGSVAGAINNELGDLTIENCDFVSNEAGTMGGALQTVGSGAKIIIKVTDGKEHVFQGNTAQTGGGAIRANTATTTVTGYKFTGNTSETEGGAVYVAGGTFTLEESNMVSNVATTDGGAIYVNSGVVTVTDGQFESNTAVNGGAILLKNASIRANISETVFKKNEATTGSGGAINNASKQYSSDEYYLTITDCTFGGAGEGNTAAENGGAIYTGSSSKVKITTTADSDVEALFEENKANITKNYGGGAINAGSGTVYIQGYTFKNNSSNYQGGAIRTTAVITIEDSIFTGNYTDATTGAQGGAIFTNNKAVTIDNCDFNNNSANTTGGAIHSNGGSACNLAITDSSFTVNSAVNGGAIYNCGLATIEDTDFGGTDLGNTASENGGAIYASNSSGTLTLSKSENATEVPYLTANAVTGETSVGAAIYVEQGTVSVSGYLINKHTAYDGGAVYVGGNDEKEYAGAFIASGCTFDSNTATQRGGAVYLSEAVAGTSATINGNSTFTNNVATNGNGGAIYTISTKDTGLLIEDSTFGVAGDTEYTYANKATAGNAYGGAVYGASASNTKIVDTNFYYNKGYNGGAIGTVNAGSMTIIREDASEAVFEGNYAARMGGAGRLYGCETGTITGYTFKDNSAVNTGGALEIERGNLSSGEVTINNCKFDGNDSTAADGGAVRVAGSGTVKLVGSTEEGNISLFTGNTAKTSGGALSTGGTGTYQISGYVFTGNTAEENGGAIYAQTTISISGSTFGDADTVNSAVNGGAIYTTAKTTITDTNFVANTATENGGAIYATNGKAVTLKKTGETTPSFTGNSAVLGGAIYTDYGTINVTGYAFTSNTASTNGGAICVSGYTVEGTSTDAETGEEVTTSTNYAGTLSTAGCTFTGNTASTNGGAVYIDSVAGEASAEIATSTFTKNVTKGNGGAICTASVITSEGKYGLTVTGCTFGEDNDTDYSEANTATNSVNKYGGAIYVVNGNAMITDTNFYYNMAGNGGAIGTGSSGTITISSDNGSEFKGNSTLTSGSLGLQGGAIRVTGAGTKLNITDYTFTSNVAYKGGGAIQVEGSTLNANNCKFDSNSCTIGNAGAILVAASGKVYLNKNVADNGNSLFNNNSAVNGGALATGGSGTYEIYNYTFTKNSATSYGGAIYTQTNLAVTNCTFGGESTTDDPYALGNTAKRGGAVYSGTDSRTFTFSACDFIGNSVSSWGGACCFIGAGYTATFKDGGEFTSNKTADVGGALVLSTGSAATVDITGYTFTNNISTRSDYYLIKNNTIWIGGSTLNLYSCTFDQTTTVAFDTNNIYAYKDEKTSFAGEY